MKRLTEDQTKELTENLRYLLEKSGWRQFITALQTVCQAKAERKQRWKTRAQALGQLRSAKEL